MSRHIRIDTTLCASDAGSPSAGNVGIGVPVASPSPMGDLTRPTVLQAGVTPTSFCLLQDVSGVLSVTGAARCEVLVLPGTVGTSTHFKRPYLYAAGWE